MAVIQEAYVHGVSTRSVDDLVQGHGRGRHVEEPGQSRLCAEIDVRVNAFLNRPLEGAWPYLWLDATYIKVREGGRIVSRAVIVAVAVNDDGKREVLGVATGPSEAETFWTDFLRSLADRGLRGVKLVIADDHKGLRAAARRVFNATHQRCRVHWLRNALAHAPSEAAHGGGGHAEDDLRPGDQGRGRRPVGRRRRRAAREAAQARRADGRLPRRRARLHGLSRASIGRRSRPRTPSSGSTARSSAGPTSSGSSPTTPRSSASSAR